MPEFIDNFLKKTWLVKLILVFGFAISSVGYGPMLSWAQEPPQNYPIQTMQYKNQTSYGMHPCFTPNGNHTGFGMHNFRQNANQTGYRLHHFGQNGTRPSFKMSPCFAQNGNQPGFGSRNFTAFQSSITTSNNMPNLQDQIPIWVKNNAKWWAQNQVTDSDFVQGMQYLVQHNIIKLPTTKTTSTSISTQIPSWIKTNAAWWAQGQITDDDYIKGIQYLISNGIMKLA